MFRGIERVAHPCHVAEIVFLSFFNFHEDVYRAVIVRLDAVFHNHGVTITQLVIFVDNQLLVRFVVLFDELLGAEEVFQLVLFVGFLHHPFQLTGLEGLVAYDGDFVYFHFLLLVDVDVDDYFVLFIGIISLRNDHFGILEAFVVEVTLNQSLGTVHQVRRNLTALYHADSGFQVAALRFLHAVVAYVGNTGTHGQMDGQPNLVAFNLVSGDFHVGEQAMTPVALTAWVISSPGTVIICFLDKPDNPMIT